MKEQRLPPSPSDSSTPSAESSSIKVTQSYYVGMPHSTSDPGRDLHQTHSRFNFPAPTGRFLENILPPNRTNFNDVDISSTPLISREPSETKSKRKSNLTNRSNVNKTQDLEQQVPSDSHVLETPAGTRANSINDPLKVRDREEMQSIHTESSTQTIDTEEATPVYTRMRADSIPSDHQFLSCLKRVGHPNLLRFVNGLYAFEAASVFAILSFFRSQKADNFNEVTWSNAPVGFLYAGSSFCMNFPMAYFFSSALASSIKKAVIEPDWYLRFALGVSLFFGGATTLAGAELVTLSLKWAPDWFKYPTASFFLWNMLTTRTLWFCRYSNKMLTSMSFYCKKPALSRELSLKPFMRLLEDVSKNNYQMQSVVIQEEANKAVFDSYTGHVTFAKNFYSQLSKKENKFSHWARVSEWIAGAAFVFLLLNSVDFWLALTRKGWHELSPNFTSNDIVWVGALSHLIFYAVSVWRAPKIPADIYERFGSLQNENIDQWYQLLLTIGFLLPFVFCAWFSGAGYSESAKDMVESQAAHAVYLSEGFTTLYFFLITGLLVNGFSAITGFLNHYPTCLGKKTPSFFKRVYLESEKEELQKMLISPQPEAMKSQLARAGKSILQKQRTFEILPAPYQDSTIIFNR